MDVRGCEKKNGIQGRGGSFLREGAAPQFGWSMKCFSYTRLQLRTGMGMVMGMEMEYEPLAGESLMGHKYC